MKNFFTILLLSCSLLVQGQFSFTPGVNNIYTVGSYDYMVAYTADMKAGDKVIAVLVHGGLGEDSAYKATRYAYHKYVADGWNMKLVKAAGDTIKFIFMFAPHRGFTMSRVQPAVDQTFNHFVDLGFLDSSDHNNFVQVSISKGGQTMWYFNRNYQDHNSVYRLQFAKRTMTLSTMALTSSAYEVNATTMNYPGRHVAYYGTADGNFETQPQYTINFYNLIHANSQKRLDSLIGGTHHASTWNTATSISGYASPGTTNSNNLLAWTINLDAMSSNLAPVADAGPDQETTATTVTLDGINSTDADGSIITYEWTKVSGTGGTITNPLSAGTSVSGLSVGTYVFRLTVTDNEGAQNSDDVTITITQASGSTGGYIRYGRKAIFNNP